MVRKLVAVAVVGTVCSLGNLASSPSAAGAGLGSSVSSALVPNVIAFWDRDHGLIGSGFRYCEVGCDGGAISETTDGGVTSRVVLHTRHPVTWVAVAPPGQAWAVSDGALLHSGDGGRTWKRLGHAVGSPSFSDGRHGMGCEDGCTAGHVLLSTRDGGAHWHGIASPCRSVRGISLVTPTTGWLLCVGQPGAGNQDKAIYETTDSGRTWQLLLTVQIGGRAAGGISSYGYPLGIAFARDGAGLLWESRGTLYQTLDGGRHWKPLATVAHPEIDFGSSASVVRGRAFALLNQGNRSYRLVATTRGYSGWRTQRTWSFKRGTS